MKKALFIRITEGLVIFLSGLFVLLLLWANCVPDSQPQNITTDGITSFILDIRTVLRFTT